MLQIKTHRDPGRQNDNLHRKRKVDHKLDPLRDGEKTSGLRACCGQERVSGRLYGGTEEEDALGEILLATAL
jgi:hypothetical protein